MADDRVSDEATGLPPLEEVEQATTIVVLAWAASEGVAATGDASSTSAVRYLHARGLIDDGHGGIEWAQIHLAVPVEHAVDVAAALAKGFT